MGLVESGQFVRKSKANTPSKNQVLSFWGEKSITHKFENLIPTKRSIGYEQG